jgi:signal peptidase I
MADAKTKSQSPARSDLTERLREAAQEKPVPQSKPAAAQSGQPEMKDSFREVVETIVFVVVLVLLLKSFVAEAFVIPTGSMAETLYGYQKLVTCPKCKQVFPVNCSSEVDPVQEIHRAPVVGCTCPNCRYHINFREEGINPSWNTGDRVLVAKFLYDLGLLNLDGPKRHNVVVFKYPENPQRIHVPLNYIKRLIGLPTETIIIRYGKVYVLDGMHYDDTGVKPEDLWEHKYTHPDDKEALELFHQGKARIIRKTTPEILTMRRLVYDNDHQAVDLKGKVRPRWESEGAWTPDDPLEPHRFQSAAPGDKTSWLHYRHYIPDDERQHVSRELITDFMGYNTWETDHGHAHSSPSPSQNWVGDLMIECEVNVEKPEGEFVLELSKGVDRFQASWDLVTGICTLNRIGENGATEVLSTAQTSFKKASKYRLRFANVDERLVVWVDSSLPFGEAVVYTAPAQLGPTEQNDLEPASIGVRGCAATVTGLKLWRDTYYTARIYPDPPGPDAGIPVNFANPADWQPLRDLPARSMYVQPDHFLCMGDNSPESSDGRTWGLVPRRLLLGRAMLIYYPFSRAGRIE